MRSKRNVAAMTHKIINGMARYIDPRVDWAFKRIFGSEDTKECLITFLNGLFDGELVIKDVTFGKTEKLSTDGFANTSAIVGQNENSISTASPVHKAE